MEPVDSIIIVLGSPNDDQGNLFGVAKERCSAAYHVWQDNPSWPILLTGGYGEHFNRTSQPHAAYLRQRLIELGVEEVAFLPFAESMNTLEDASKSKPIALATGLKRALVITSDYHLARAEFVFEKEFSGTDIALSFIATKTDESLGELDYASLKAHEKAALERLKTSSQS